MRIRKIKITNIYTEIVPFKKKKKTGIIKNILKSRSVTMFCLILTHNYIITCLQCFLTLSVW